MMMGLNVTTKPRIAGLGQSDFSDDLIHPDTNDISTFVVSTACTTVYNINRKAIYCKLQHITQIEQFSHFLEQLNYQRV